MKNLYYFIFLAIIFPSCSQNVQKKEYILTLSKFVESFNDVFKSEYRNVSLESKRDVVLDSAQIMNSLVVEITGGGKVKLTSEEFIVEFSNKDKRKLRIDFYSDLDSLGLHAFETGFNDRQFMGEVSSKVKVGKFYCELLLNVKNAKEGLFLLSVEKLLLENYIKQIEK
jgi:hypothetical protein